MVTKQVKRHESSVTLVIEALKGSKVFTKDFLLVGLIKSAKNGSRPESLTLLRRFADKTWASNPLVIEYIAECIGRWAADDFASVKATDAFNLKRPKHRPKAARTEAAHVTIVETYLRLRAQGVKAGVAIRQAADTCACSEKLVARLIVGLHHDSRPFTSVQNSAIRNLSADADKDEGTLQRALGGGWQKLQRDVRAYNARWDAMLRSAFGPIKPTPRKSPVK